MPNSSSSSSNWTSWRSTTTASSSRPPSISSYTIIYVVGFRGEAILYILIGFVFCATIVILLEFYCFRASTRYHRECASQQSSLSSAAASAAASAASSAQQQRQQQYNTHHHHHHHHSPHPKSKSKIDRIAGSPGKMKFVSANGANRSAIRCKLTERFESRHNKRSSHRSDIKGSSPRGE